MITEAIILSGGLGSRLRSVIADRPKPMAVISGQPFLGWLLLALRSREFKRVILSIGYKGEVIEDYFRNHPQPGLELIFSRERSPLGTGGAARFASQWVNTDHVLVLNGDSYCDFEIDRLEQVHLYHEAQATLYLVPVADRCRFGAVEIESDGRVVAFREKGDQNQGLINAGVYLFTRSALGAIPTDRAVSLETEVLPSLIGKGLYAFVGDGPFLDIGTPDSYALAQSSFSSITGMRGV